MPDIYPLLLFKNVFVCGQNKCGSISPAPESARVKRHVVSVLWLTLHSLCTVTKKGNIHAGLCTFAVKCRRHVAGSVRSVRSVRWICTHSARVKRHVVCVFSAAGEQAVSSGFNGYVAAGTWPDLSGLSGLSDGSVHTVRA